MTTIVQLGMKLGFSGPSWSAWWSVLKAAYALPMTDKELATFRQLAHRDPPKKQVRELWIIAGRRAGKDSVASLIATHAAITDRSGQLRPGEMASVICLAVDRKQASIVRRYISGYFSAHPLLHGSVSRETQNGLEVGEQAEIEVIASDYRSVRGRTVACCVADEIAFWTDEGGSPDREVYSAVMPGLATLPGAIFVGISTPYARRGLLYEKWRRHFGQDNDDVLVIQAESSRQLNPTLSQAIVDAAYADDPAVAASEYGGQFRQDIDNFLTREVLDGITAFGRYEIAPERRHGYVAFADPAGGGGSDSFTLAIAHREGDIGIVDVVREWRPPFQPSQVVAECAYLMRAYGVRSIECDKYGANFVVELFSSQQVTCEQSAKPKSDLYREFLAIANSRRCELLDHPKSIAQFLALERRVARGGRDSIDHPPGPNSHDDVANSIAGAVVKAVAGPNWVQVWNLCGGSTASAGLSSDQIIAREYP